jgi:hypothetical protein
MNTNKKQVEYVDLPVEGVEKAGDVVETVEIRFKEKPTEKYPYSHLRSKTFWIPEHGEENKLGEIVMATAKGKPVRFMRMPMKGADAREMFEKRELRVHKVKILWEDNYTPYIVEEHSGKKINWVSAWIRFKNDFDLESYLSEEEIGRTKQIESNGLTKVVIRV